MSPHPYIGVLGVFLGATIATLNSRLLSVGLADLRGALGAGFDEASWIPTALNMATMFIGPFSVWLATLFGPRAVLLSSGAIFTVVSLLLPFAPSLPAVLALQVVAGLSSGTFYPLTLTFVVRNLPPKLIILGVGAYALDIVFTSNIGALIQGILVEQLSWRWMFWCPAVLTPLMMLCVYAGVPRLPNHARPFLRTTDWRGFLYVSLGLSLIYGALDQGERLDWLNSGLVVALLAAGSFLLLVAAGRRYRSPNPMINLPFLNARNVIILGLGIFFIRFTLLTSILVIPGYLGNVQQYRALQTGASLAWVAAPEFVFVWIAALLTIFINSRIVMAAGFGTIAVAAWLCAHLDSSWSGQSFVLREVLLAAGIALAFVGLVTSLLLLALEMGAVTSVGNAATFSSSMHGMRILGGQAGVALLTHFLSEREKFHSNMLGLGVDAGNWITAERLRGLAAAFAPISNGMEEAQARAAALLGYQVRAQAYTLACGDALLLVCAAIVSYLLIAAFLRPSQIQLSDLRRSTRAQRKPTSRTE
ncbi:MAG TPA: MFS transporter [Bryobacteraceae bacterium]|nr:MFS transporter [Bryobacteraceae bacterium]